MVYNVVGTLNQGGLITEEIMLMMSHKGHKEKAVFEVCDLGKATMIVGHPWLKKHNPEIDWKMGEVKLTHCLSECNVFIQTVKEDQKWKKISEKWKYKVMMEEVDDEEAEVHIRSGILDDANTIMDKIIEEHFIRKTESEEAMPDLCINSDNDDDEDLDDDEIMVFQIENSKKAWYIASTSGPASQGNKNLNSQMKDEKKKMPEKMVPKQFHKYMKVFLKQASKRMLIRKPWNHMIEMNHRFEPKKAKNILLSLQEQKEAEEFLNDQLSKGYIQESKSLQTSVVFFILKKDMRKH